jgi:site-specific DNA recombinase
VGAWWEEAEAAVVAEISAWYLQPGHSLYSGARRLRALGELAPRDNAVWGAATRRGMLMNPTDTGQVYAGRPPARPPRIRRAATHPRGRMHDSRVPRPAAEWIPVATVPAVMTAAQFAQAKAKLAENQSFATRNNKAPTSLLRALVSGGHGLRACQGPCASTTCAITCAPAKWLPGNAPVGSLTIRASCLPRNSLNW